MAWFWKWLSSASRTATAIRRREAKLKKLEKDAFSLRETAPDRAAAFFRSILSEAPERVSSLRAFGRLLLKLRDYDAARPLWERLRRLTPEDQEPSLQLARIHAKAHRLPELMAMATDVLRLEPGHPEAMTLIVGAAEKELQTIADTITLDNAAIYAERIDRLAPWLDGNPTLHRLRLLCGNEVHHTAGAALSAALPEQPIMQLNLRPLRSMKADRDAAILTVYDVARERDAEALLVSLESLSTFSGDNDVDDLLRLQLEDLIERLIFGGIKLPPNELLRFEDRVVTLAASLPAAAGRLIQHIVHRGDSARALRLLSRLADAAAPSMVNVPLPAADASVQRLDAAMIVGICEKAFGQAMQERPIMSTVAMLLAAQGHHEQAIAVWQRVNEAGPFSFELQLRYLRALDTAGLVDVLIPEAARTIEQVAPLEELRPREQNFVIELIRRIAQSVAGKRCQKLLPVLEAALQSSGKPGRLTLWALGALQIARFDRQAALARFDEALTKPPLPSGTALDLHAERALVLTRYHLFGEALEELEQASPALLSKTDFYKRRFLLVRRVVNFCPEAPRPLRYAECVVDSILSEIEAQPNFYEPRERHVCMVSSSLGQGGGERQAFTVVRRMLREPRVEKLSLLVRSIHLRPNDGFFYPEVSRLPLETVVYGEDWPRRSSPEMHLPELASRPRLLTALDLLPHNAREDIVRLCRQFWDRRPQAVHIWQDIYTAAIACVIAGVPNFFIHRGSLSPDHWEHNEYQAAVHFRIMRHSYRRLLERPDFVILNNSVAGCRTDQNWTSWPDARPFQVLYNAVDFTALGPNSGRNFELRHSLGIPDEAPVVGGSFRIVSVKRPRYWIEAARQILATVPEAHFLIIGDGEMTDEIVAFAQGHGFADRLHLPGRVSNVGDWYRAMDLKLLTSEREGIPNAIIEAQHFGVPIVATDVGGIAEAVEVGRTGYVVADGGPAEYARVVTRILRDPEWHEAARHRAPDYVHGKFSLDRIVDQLMGYYGIDARSPKAA